MSKNRIWHLSRRLKEGKLSLLLPTSTLFFVFFCFRSQTEKDHLNIFLENNTGFLEKLRWHPRSKRMHSTQNLAPLPPLVFVPPPLQPLADSGHVGCECPLHTECSGAAIKPTATVGRAAAAAAEPAEGLYSGGAARRSSSLRSGKAQPVRGWCRLSGGREEQSEEREQVKQQKIQAKGAKKTNGMKVTNLSKV